MSIYRLYMHLLCMHCHGYSYACIGGKRRIVMVIVVVMCRHDAIRCYDANVLTEMKQEMKINKVRLQHYTSG